MQTKYFDKKQLANVLITEMPLTMQNCLQHKTTQ